MPDGVDPAMNAVKATSGDAIRHPAGKEARRLQLRGGNHAVLVGR
jgi:hypothetical protein